MAFERMQTMVSIQNKVFTNQLNKMHELVNSHNAQVLQLLYAGGNVAIMPPSEQMVSRVRGGARSIFLSRVRQGSADEKGMSE